MQYIILALPVVLFAVLIAVSRLKNGAFTINRANLRGGL